MDGGKPVPGAKPTRTNDAGAAAERFLSDTTREVDELSHSAGAAPPARPTPPARAPRALPDVKPAPPPPVRKRAESERAYDPESTTMPHKPTPSADAIAAAVLAIANEDLTVVEGSSEANIAPGDHGFDDDEPFGEQTFGRTLWSELDLIVSEAEDDVVCLRDIRGFIKAIVEAERSFGNELVKLVSGAMKKASLKKYLNRPFATVNSGRSGLLSLFQSVTQQGTLHVDLASALDTDVVEPLDRHLSDLERAAKHHAGLGRALKKEERDVLMSLGRARVAAHKALREKEIAEKTLEDRRADSKPKELEKLERKATKCGDDAHELMGFYVVEADNTNAFLDVLYGDRMPTVLNAFQTLHEDRAVMVKTSMCLFSQRRHDMVTREAELMGPLVNFLDRITPEEETQAFIRDHKPKSKTFKRFEVVQYQSGQQQARRRLIPRKPRVERPSQSVAWVPQFGVSLTELMQRQAATNPELPVPHLLRQLIAWLVALNPYAEPGIFRKPGSKTTIEQLRNSINLGTPVAPSDVDDAASLLKGFLRDLADPVIPLTAYPAAMELLQRVGDDGPSDEQIGELLSTLPDVNRCVLVELCAFLADLTRPEVVKVTLMPVYNLSVCFAPSLMRSPSTNPVEVMQNLDNEVTLVSFIIPYAGRLAPFQQLQS